MMFPSAKASYCGAPGLELMGTRIGVADISSCDNPRSSFSFEKIALSILKRFPVPRLGPSRVIIPPTAFLRAAEASGHQPIPR